jgi:hypothetical protein
MSRQRLRPLVFVRGDTYVGIPCKLGHTKRYASSHKCVQCQATLRVKTTTQIAAYGREYRLENSDKIRAAYERHNASAFGKYRAHKNMARRRGIAWLFTFESWLTFWGDDFVRRGLKPDDLVCARRGDTGPYSPENCDKITRRENTQQYLARTGATA